MLSIINQLHLLNPKRAIPILKLKSGQKEVSLISNNHKVYFNNINFIGIFYNGEKSLKNKKDIIMKCSTFLDVGAHMGANSFWFNQINPKAKIISIEANPNTYKLLNKNLRHIDRKVLFNEAVSDNSSPVDIYEDPLHLDTASINPTSHYLTTNNKNNSLQKTKIIARPLDSHISDIDSTGKVYIKIDVETYERAVIKGATEILNMANYLEIEIYQDRKMTGSEILKNIPFDYNILEYSEFSPERQYPKVINLFLERIYGK